MNESTGKNEMMDLDIIRHNYTEELFTDDTIVEAK